MQLTLCGTPDSGLDHLQSLSPFCVKVHRALRHLNRPYERRFGPPSAFASLNPAGKVPILLMNGAPIPDSTRILARLGVPGDSEAKLWEELADVSINGFVVAARWADDANWPRAKEAFFGAMPAPLRAIIPNRTRRRIIRELEARDVWLSGPEDCWARFEALLDQLDHRAPSAAFWMGEQPTVADFAIFGQLHSLRCEITPWQHELLARRNRLTRYLDRVHRATST